MWNHIFSVLEIGWKLTGFLHEVKVRCLCLTLTGEARLWYESLAPLDNDWQALQNKFRRQYSKIGNTPKQLFHAWRTFKFDENTGHNRLLCIENQPGSSNAKLWRNADFRKFQKHPSILDLYSTLINVNNLGDAIDLAKRVLMKEKFRQTANWTILHPIYENDQY